MDSTARYAVMQGDGEYRSGTAAHPRGGLLPVVERGFGRGEGSVDLCPRIIDVPRRGRAPILFRRRDDADPAAAVGQDERLPGSQSPDEVTGLLPKIRRTDDSHRRSVQITARGFRRPRRETDPAPAR